MDFITHALVGAGVARLACPRREWLPQLTAAGLLGSLAMDGDSWLAFVNQDAYGLYHRVLTHNVFALALFVPLTALGARALGAVPRWRGFGWFVASNLPTGAAPSRPPWRLFFLITAVCVVLHWLLDSITGFGNLKPFWPLSPYSVELRAVNSLDGFILGGTLAWHVLLRVREWPRRREAQFSAAYAALLVAYVAARLAWFPPTCW